MTTIKLADYLFVRLRQLGVLSVHGVPGDFNLNLLDYIQPSGLRWVVNTNELNAAYAADGYARIKGIGAIITTFGVGELSAINAIAGAYAEFAPVVHIVGMPAREIQDNHSLTHHTFNDGEFRRFSAMHVHVTVAQARLDDPKTSAEKIDQTLKQCLLYSRPVYIEVPVDMVAKPLSRIRFETPISISDGEQDENSDAVFGTILQRTYSAKQPVVIVDGETRPMGIRDNVQALIKSTGWPTWTTPFGKGLTDETLSSFYGVYKGAFDDPLTRSFYEDSDLVLFFGPHFTSSNSYGYSNKPKDSSGILFTTKGVEIGGKFLFSYETFPQLSKHSIIEIPASPSNEPLTQEGLWCTLANFIEPGDIVLGEPGTAGYGVQEMPLPRHTRLFTPITWLSIGYMLPGAQGAALAQRELLESGEYFEISSAKTVLFIGDGSFQMTVQEISSIVRHNLNVVIFIINNDGYTIERAIHGRKQGYNDIAPWRNLLAPRLFGAKDGTYTGSARTWRDLKGVLEDERLLKDKELRMVEIFLDREDCPKGPLLHNLETQKQTE
ncbi:pyruvate decarboxylase [Fusarium sporotrichioides]|uniref:Pyruvate decarboxylase n=1 Tax=Fusarium sporotrichioides TaxID=5514 RepID=A0A395RE31_FUSSP|nr:pyruvate decarboxylase [Fusarium sporotrichioides]